MQNGTKNDHGRHVAALTSAAEGTTQDVRVQFRGCEGNDGKAHRRLARTMAEAIKESVAQQSARAGRCNRAIRHGSSDHELIVGSVK